MKLAIKLDPRDHVAVAMEAAGTGEVLSVLSDQGTECDQVEVGAALPLPYHKIALVAIPVGALLRKYGEVIGYAAAPIGRGDWVHTHNLQSATFGEREEVE